LFAWKCQHQLQTLQISKSAHVKEAGLIRGAIEVAHEKLVSGWIHDSVEPLRNKLVLAFCGDRCVGTGKVEIFRKDLADAKLGDGYCGFHFPVALERGEHPGSIVVRLANSDAALIQAKSRVVPA
jgi:hypothetical protein